MLILGGPMIKDYKERQLFIRNKKAFPYPVCHVRVNNETSKVLLTFRKDLEQYEAPYNKRNYKLLCDTLDLTNRGESSEDPRVTIKDIGNSQVEMEGDIAQSCKLILKLMFISKKSFEDIRTDFAFPSEALCAKSNVCTIL